MDADASVITLAADEGAAMPDSIVVDSIAVRASAVILFRVVVLMINLLLK